MTKTQAIIFLSNHGIDEKQIDDIIEAFSQEPRFYPPCADCNKKMDEIRKTYDNKQ
jgi:hypothetical protein